MIAPLLHPRTLEVTGNLAANVAKIEMHYWRSRAERRTLTHMKIVAIIVRVLLGLMFVVFGSNAFLHFMQMPPMPGPAGEFIGAMNAPGYLQAVAALQVIGGLLLLIGFVPLGLMALGPIIVNIVFFHVFMERSGLGMALVIAALALFLLWYHRNSFAGLLRSLSAHG